jgi:2,3-bisphosphoglycerate-dependent phosphoglycerate mutase
MRLFFIRHAQSSNNALVTETGSSHGRSEDPELTELGEEQAQRLAAFLRNGDPTGGLDCKGTSGKGFGITHIYTSLMVRAVATGLVIAKALGLPYVGWEELHEEGGIYLDDAESGKPVGLAGKNRSYFEKNYPDFVIPKTLGEEGWWNHRPFEPVEERMLRAQKFLGQLLERHGDTEDQVAVISHGGFYVNFMIALLSLPKQNGFWLTMYNTGISRIDFLESGPNLVYQNRIDFLPADMVT